MTVPAGSTRSFPNRPCSKCGAEVIGGDKYCASCGTPVGTACEECGALVGSGDRFCPSCGAPRRETAPDRTGEFESLWAPVLRRLREALKNDYRISRELGRGGQAAVFLAEERSLHRQVAIKVLAPGTLADDLAVDRFRGEARRLAALEHEHIVPIYAVRQVEELHCFVMRYIVGRSLAAIITDCGQLPLNVIKAIAFQVGSALQYAHRRGVVHRDVKPANVLFSEEGSAIVTDFGIAKDLSGSESTVTGMLMGTPAYMSPEQCRQETLSWSSDQYSLGVVLYEMLTGKVPFEGMSLEMMVGHTDREPRPIRGLRADCPVEMEWAVLRMLRKRPADRWLSMGEALDALGAGPLAMDDPIRNTLQKLALEGYEYRGSAVTPTDPSRPMYQARIPTPASSRMTPQRETARPTPPKPVDVVRPEPVARTPTPVVPRTALPDPVVQPPDEPVEVTAPDELEVPAARRSTPWVSQRTTPPVVVPDLPPDSEDEKTRRAAKPNAIRRRVIRWSSIGLPVVLVLAVSVSMLNRQGSDEVATNDELPPDTSTSVPVVIPEATTAPVVVRGDTATTATITASRRDLVVNDSLQLRAAFLRGRVNVDAPRPVRWESLNPSVVRIDPSTGSASAMAPGEARIRVTAGAVNRDITIRVAARTATNLSVAGPQRLTAGESRPLSVTATDQRGAPIQPTAVEWRVLEPTLASVDGNGRVTALREGTAQLEVSAGSARAIHSITIDPRPVVTPPLIATQGVATRACTVSEACTFVPVTGSGGRGPYAYGVVPNLPRGLAFDNTTGGISGAPQTAQEPTRFTVTVTDQAGATSRQSFQLVVSRAEVQPPPAQPPVARPPAAQPPAAQPPAETSVTDAEVLVFANVITQLIKSKDVASLRARYQGNGAPDDKRRDDLLGFLSGALDALDVGPIRVATTERDRLDMVRRVQFEMPWRTRYDRGRTTLELVFPIEGTVRGQPFRVFRIGNSPRY